MTSRAPRVRPRTRARAAGIPRLLRGARPTPSSTPDVVSRGCPDRSGAWAASRLRPLFRDRLAQVLGELAHHLVGLLADDGLAELADATHDLRIGLHLQRGSRAPLGH